MDIMNPLQDPLWDQHILKLKDASFFHTSIWAKTLKDSYGYTPNYLVKTEDGVIKALLPVMQVKSFLTGSRGVSLPFTDYCFPLLAEDYSLEELFEELKDYGQKQGWKYIELRGKENTLSENAAKTDYYRHYLELAPEIESVYKSMKGDTGHLLIRPRGKMSALNSATPERL